MNIDALFDPGTTTDIVPKGDVDRQAVDSLRGYAYQAIAAALAWCDIDERGRLFLEVAEDYSIVAGKALKAVQVKDTERSGTVTLNSDGVRDAVYTFVDLVGRNPDIQIDLRYFTTSEIGREHAIADRPAGMAGLDFWRKAAAGADVSPLRAILASHNFPESVRVFVNARDDTALRGDLLTRIHWDCGRPNLLTLRQELEQRLIVVGRDRFNLPASEAQRLADHLICRVLEKSVVKATQDRVLTRAALYATIDTATRLSVPRATAYAVSQIASGFLQSLGAASAPATVLLAETTGPLIAGEMLPTPRGMIRRETVESAAANALKAFGTCVLVGGSGLGKSNVSRAVVRAHASEFTILDLRDIDVGETSRRLDTVFAHIGGIRSSALILEDLNQLDDPRVALSLARVIEALRRRDRVAFITCYRRPSAKAVAGAGLDQGCVIDCPYFSEKESHELVHINGGDPDKWGRLAYLAGATGHPQLTHAFVVGAALRGWPVEEIDNIINRGLSSEDIDAERDAARRTLASSLPDRTRRILYRLSLICGRFDRSLALTIGDLPPPVPQAGECVDQLAGPWIEAAGADHYRISPLASGFGREMLTPEEQICIHKTIAFVLLKRREIDARDVDTIFFHGIGGKAPECLTIIANCVLTSDSRTLELLSEYLFVLPILRTDQQILPENPPASGLLRLAQFKLAAAGGKWTKASEIATALFNEIRTVRESEVRRALEATMLASVLSTIGIANYLDNWIDLLCRFYTVIESDESLQRLKVNFESSSDTDGMSLFGVLFSIGSAGLASVEQLELVINALDDLDANQRALWLTPVEKSVSDYSVLINGPWASQERDKAFDAADATARYHRMAQKTRHWGIRPLALQCFVARAVMLDEYQNDKEGALAALEEAAASLGDDPIIARARARVHLRHDEHGRALQILRGIADEIGVDNPVERAFALREAAISAAKNVEWSLAEKWFREAQNAAKLCQGDDMNAMAIGLGADSAVATLEAGDVSISLVRLGEAVEALVGLTPDASLRAAYCHRVIRHTVLWAKSRICGEEVKIEGAPVAMRPGTCSNPNPLPAIRELPLGAIDLAWYMLAEAEIAGDVDVGVAKGLGDRLTLGAIPTMEANLRLRRMEVDVDGLDADGFALHLAAYVEGAAYVSKEADHIKATFDPLSPERGQIPTVNQNPPHDPVVERAAIDAILAYGIRAALAFRSEAMMELEGALDRVFAEAFPGKIVFDHWNGMGVSLGQLEHSVVDFIKVLLQREHVQPYEFWMAGLYFFEWSDRSNFGRRIIRQLANCQKVEWKRITEEESFRLHRPRQTVPVIQTVLSEPAVDRRFVARILITTSEAVRASLGTEYRDRLKSIEEEAQPTSKAV